MNQPFQDIPHESKPLQWPADIHDNYACVLQESMRIIVQCDDCGGGGEAQLSGTYWCLSPSPSFSSSRTIGFHLIVIARHTSLPCPASRFVFALTPLFHSYLVISPSYSLFSDLLSRRLRTRFWRDINGIAGRFIVRDLIWIHYQHSCRVNLEYLRCKIIAFEFPSVGCLLTGCMYLYIRLKVNTTSHGNGLRWCRFSDFCLFCRLQTTSPHGFNILVL